MTKSYYQKTEQQKRTQTEFFKLFKGKPFWIPDKKQHEQEYDKTKGMCCFWHIRGLPEKQGRGRLPVFDYEWNLYQAIEQDKYVWLKKSAGLGISTFMLYYIAYKSITSELWKGKQVVIITGPNIDIAITLIKRLKALFPVNMLPQTKETVCEIGSVHCEAFPSHHLDSARGLEKPICIWLDEADYFPPGQQDEARVIAERYIGKSPGMSIIMTSTPNAPEGLYENIERLPQEQCLYHRMIMTYEIGLNKIYTPQEIAKARESPSFPREYEGQYIGVQGNVFSNESIEHAISTALDLENKGYSINAIPQDTHKSMGIDAGWGSSKFAIVITQLVPSNKYKDIQATIQVLYAEEFERPNFDDMINHIIKLKRNYTVEKMFVDAANPEVIQSVKAGLNERVDYERHISNLKSRHPKYLNLATFMDVIPVSFSTDGRNMLAHTKACLDRSWISIHPSFHKLIIALKTAQATDGLLDKQATAHNDVLDAFRLSLSYYKSTSRNN